MFGLFDVAIYGVGRIGAALAHEVVRRKLCSTLFITNRSLRRLDGIALSLQIGASAYNSPVKIRTFQGKLPAAVRVVIIAIKEDYDPRVLLQDEKLPFGIQANVRTIGLRRDIPLVRDVCRNLGSFDGLIVVLTNPVDLFCALVREWVPEASVVGLGLSLDTARLLFEVQSDGFSVQSGDGLLGGVHIGRLVPLRSLWPMGGSMRGMSAETLDKLIERSGKIGPRIVRDLGFTLYDCMSVFGNDIEKILLPRTAHQFLLASIAEDGRAVGRPLIPSISFKMTPVGISMEEEREILSAGDLVGDMLAFMKANRAFAALIS